jgi:hypothetical protein
MRKLSVLLNYRRQADLGKLFDPKPGSEKEGQTLSPVAVGGRSGPTPGGKEKERRGWKHHPQGSTSDQQYAGARD